MDSVLVCTKCNKLMFASDAISQSDEDVCNVCLQALMPADNPVGMKLRKSKSRRSSVSGLFHQINESSYTNCDDRNLCAEISTVPSILSSTHYLIEKSVKER